MAMAPSLPHPFPCLLLVSRGCERWHQRRIGCAPWPLTTSLRAMPLPALLDCCTAASTHPALLSIQSLLDPDRVELRVVHPGAATSPGALAYSLQVLTDSSSADLALTVGSEAGTLADPLVFTVLAK